MASKTIRREFFLIAPTLPSLQRTTKIIISPQTIISKNNEVDHSGINVSDQEIVDFYKEISRVLSGRDFRILYLLTKDIRANINVIRKERSDDQGNEWWFPLMLGYFNNSPYLPI